MRINRFLVAAGIAIGALATAAVPAAVSAAPAQAASGNLFASVGGSGTLAHGHGVTSVTHLGTGQYEVRFATNVQNCAYVATTINAFSGPAGVYRRRPPQR